MADLSDTQPPRERRKTLLKPCKPQGNPQGGASAGMSGGGRRTNCAGAGREGGSGGQERNQEKMDAASCELAMKLYEEEVMRLSREDFRAQQTETERLRNESNDSTEANIQKNNQRQQASVTSSPDHGSMATQALIWQMHEEEQKTSGDHELARRLQESYSDFKCPICIETLSREDVFIVSTCLHEFCRPCIAEHINTQISAQCFPILCPCCNRTDPDCELSQQDLSILLETEDYERYLRSTLSLHISQTPSILSCPQPDCQGAAEVIPPETNFICPWYDSYGAINHQTFHVLTGGLTMLCFSAAVSQHASLAKCSGIPARPVSSTRSGARKTPMQMSAQAISLVNLVFRCAQPAKMLLKNLKAAIT